MPKPRKIRYYLERRDPEFDRKMQEILLIYRDVPLLAEVAFTTGTPIYPLSVDEMPSVQALGLTAPGLPPVSYRVRLLKNGPYILACYPVTSLDELKTRILNGINEINRLPPSCFEGLKLARVFQ